LIRPALYQAHHEIVEVQRTQTQQRKEFDVVGPVCESSDVLGYSRQLGATEGELLAVLSAGAYGFVMSSNYNTRPRAAEVMIDGVKATIVRDRETVQGLVSGEYLLD